MNLIKKGITSSEKIRNWGNYIYDYAYSFFESIFNPSCCTGKITWQLKSVMIKKIIIQKCLHHQYLNSFLITKETAPCNTISKRFKHIYIPFIYMYYLCMKHFRRRVSECHRVSQVTHAERRSMGHIMPVNVCDNASCST